MHAEITDPSYKTAPAVGGLYEAASHRPANEPANEPATAPSRPKHAGVTDPSYRTAPL